MNDFDRETNPTESEHSVAHIFILDQTNTGVRHQQGVVISAYTYFSFKLGHPQYEFAPISGHLWSDYCPVN